MRAGGMTLPLREPIYRRIWLASVLSNLGQLIGAVGAAWAMTQLTADIALVALVQAATMLPLMLWSIPAGAMADMFDRRKVALAGLAMSLGSAGVLWLLAWSGLVTPSILLLFCFLIGSGMAIFAPAWQSSVAEQVPATILPQAIALNAISYNIARSFGPAIGGIIVAAAGAPSAFAVNTVFYLPLIAVLLLWRRVHPTPHLPPERVDRAIVSGMRYVFHSPAIRTVMLRTLLMGTIGAAVSALMPLIARDLLGGGSSTYGVILGAFGMGAIGGALLVPAIRDRFSGEVAARGGAVILGAATAVVGLSSSIWLTVLALGAAGAMWMLGIALFNIAVQTSAPRWVTGRILATFQASITGGMALGSWLWGLVAADFGITATLLLSGGLMILSPIAGRWLRIPEPAAPLEEALVKTAQPDVALALTPRSGPIVIEIEYRVPPERARDFYGVMQAVQSSRQRNGGYDWSIARNVADAGVWIERFHFPTWLDYLRHRERATTADRALLDEAAAFQEGLAPVQVRRMLERPFGSVRWKDSAPDSGPADRLPLA